MTPSIDSFLAEWSAAERDGDTDKLEELLSDDFIGIGPLGFSLPKAEWLGRHRQGLAYEAFELAETSLRTYGETAIIITRLSQEARPSATPSRRQSEPRRCSSIRGRGGA